MARLRKETEPSERRLGGVSAPIPTKSYPGLPCPSVLLTNDLLRPRSCETCRSRCVHATILQRHHNMIQTYSIIYSAVYAHQSSSELCRRSLLHFFDSTPILSSRIARRTPCLLKIDDSPESSVLSEYACICTLRALISDAFSLRASIDMFVRVLGSL
jgi:hypothetical protein